MTMFTLLLLSMSRTDSFFQCCQTQCSHCYSFQCHGNTMFILLLFPMSWTAKQMVRIVISSSDTQYLTVWWTPKCIHLSITDELLQRLFEKNDLTFVLGGPDGVRTTYVSSMAGPAACERRTFCPAPAAQHANDARFVHGGPPPDGVRTMHILSTAGHPDTLTTDVLSMERFVVCVP